MGVKVKPWKGAWWVFVNHKGRRKAKRVGVGKEGQRAAKAAAEKIQAKLALGDTALLDEAPDRNPLTVAQYVEDWLRSYGEARLKPGSIEKYTMVLRQHWLPELGLRPVGTITREAIKTVLAKKLAAGFKPRTVRGHVDILRSCLSLAVEDGLLATNPAARLGKFTPRPTDTEVETFTREELVTLLTTAEREQPAIYPIVLTLARTGLRIGEALTLQVGDLDFEQRALWVRRTWGSRTRALGDRCINAPKSNRVRRVDMSEQLCRVLQSHVMVREAEAVLQGRPLPSLWLFPGADGGPMHPSAFWRSWARLLRQAGLLARKPHTLRHTFASLLLQQGESPAYVRDQLGHASIKITVDTYGHLIPGANRQAVNRLDDATIRNPSATEARVLLEPVEP